MAEINNYKYNKTFFSTTGLGSGHTRAEFSDAAGSSDKSRACEDENILIEDVDAHGMVLEQL